jgi:hypothetical protein
MSADRARSRGAGRKKRRLRVETEPPKREEKGLVGINYRRRDDGAPRR